MRHKHVLFLATSLFLAVFILGGIFGSSCSSWLRSGFWERATAEDVRECLDEGADVAERTEYGIGPLHRAAAHGTAETVRVLIGAGADVEAQTDWAITPLYSAVQGRNLETVRVLLDAGAKFETHGGCTANPCCTWRLIGWSTGKKPTRSRG